MPNCKECGKIFQENSKHRNIQEYCSSKCRQHHWVRENRQHYNKLAMQSYYRHAPKRYCRICGVIIHGNSVTCQKIKCKKETKKQNEKKYRESLKLKALNMLGGPRCINCGCTEIKALEINHKKGGGYQEGAHGKGTWLWLDIIQDKRDLKDFEVTCRVCNACHYMSLKGIEGWKVIWNGKKFI